MTISLPVLDWLAKRQTSKRLARSYYDRIVAQSRLPDFYTEMGVPDTVDGRFELLVLHLFLALERVRRQEGGDPRLPQRLVELFVADMDVSLRELGVGDLSVPKKMRAIAATFYSRLAEYRDALVSGDQARLAAAIAKHVVAGDQDRLSVYARDALNSSAKSSRSWIDPPNEAIA